jgi:hypothetical protein
MLVLPGLDIIFAVSSVWLAVNFVDILRHAEIPELFFGFIVPLIPS